MEKYNIRINDLQYLGLITAIPKQWRTDICNFSFEQLENSKPHLEILLNDKKPNKIIYNFLIRNLNDKPIAYTYWDKVKREEMVNDFENISWSSILSNMKLVIKDNKVLQFQFKLIHKISSCNYWLSKMKIKDDPTCDKCNNDIETLEHLYWECPSIQTFLLACFDILRSLNFSTNINKWSFILGQGIFKHEIILHQIFALIKYHIYISRLNTQEPCFEVCLKILRDTFETEKRGALCRGSKENMKFNFKWKNFLLLWSETNIIN